MSWEDKTLGEQALEHKNKILEELQKELGDAWNNIQQEDKEILEYCAKRMAELSIQRLAGKEVEEDIKNIEVAIGNMMAAEKLLISQKFWVVFHKVIGTAGTFIGNIAKSFIPGGALLG